MLQRVASLLRHLPPLTANRGLLYGSGSTVPADASDGWQVGALFSHTDGTAGTAIYVNEGSITSSDFNAIVTAGYGTPITITPTAPGTFLDFELETEWTGGTLIRADMGSATVFASSVVGFGLDLGTNATATHEQDVTGILVTLPASTNSAASPDLKGLQVAVSGAMTTSVSGTATFRGVQIATPAITQTAGAVVSHGIHVTGGTITSGTAYGIELTGAWTTALNIGGTSVNSSIQCNNTIVVAPTGTGTMINFVLETEWTTGTLILADFGSSTAFTSAVIGSNYDFGTNVVATSEQSVTGYKVTLPQSTNTAASPALRGLVVEVSGAMTAGTSGDPTYIGVEVTTPDIDCTLDTIVSTGLDITTGALTQTGGTATSNGIALTGGAITSGTATAINMDGAWTVGVTINGTVATGIAIDTCTTAAITAKDVIRIAPEAAGNLLDFVLETEWVSGTMIEANFGGGTTLTGSVIGCNLDFGANVVATSEQSVTGFQVTLPQSTNTAASPALVGLNVAVTGAMTAGTSGDPTYTGVQIATPAINCTLDTITSTGLSITTGQVTQTGGTAVQQAILLTGGTITSGTSRAIHLAGTFDSLVSLPAAGTAPVETGGAIGTHGTATLKIRIEIAGVEYFLLASTVPTF